MKKALKTLAKELDFSNETEYFDYMIDSHINGNIKQCKDLFNDMRQADRKAFVSYLNGQAQFNGLLETRNFYFNLL